jgi:hypothetical protein
MKLSVRLGEKEQKALRGLRRRKVNVSALVRKALVTADQETERKPRSDREVLEDIIRRYPSPPPDDLPKRPRLDDRKAVSEFIRQRLRRQ